MGEITIKQLAQILKVSTATVSKALRDSHEIGAATKKRVQDLAKSLNYSPNPFASGLRRHKSNTIAVILPEIANNFFAQAVNGIDEVAREKGYHLLIYLSHDSSEREAFFLNDLLSRRVDGLLMSISFDASDFTHLDAIQQKLPTVFFDRTYEGSLLHVTNNDFESAFDATRHLYECGCRNIAFLSAFQTLKTGDQRFKGYLSALKHCGLPFKDELIVHCNNNKNDSYTRIRELMTEIKPDGIVSSIEKLAKQCYYVCNELEINIPGDVKIVSYSNLDSASLLNPPLTTITQQAFEMGKEAATILFKVLKNSNYKADSKILNAELIKRRSTDIINI
ncbi:LacI family DNA-binding transcriptional regulator [Mucilaginibacter phyllosphaerae]|uniref:LacI family transcriptional regulator n=1 Tax=Mucilaginibacter phyllosphaerae TaxID=1812349 RepID=A0A4Y8AJQ6_9SPHI|nr:LacI family DNA-binding transcriptional regulator [Mucilaginibacter phyllosphaerae]MBB3967702.1 LacI family transcriptional regulator [Mucilaginibacter phyllosphaerae]TEW69243.1 LacI family transcriptional regulator [Mucilaginibacter phyllosphaerae]GGH03890.1 DNA-binding transcriptional regulator CytR [Mucilaginibacter phyllosphaerae]